MSHKLFRSFFVLIFVIGLLAIQAPQSVRAAGPWYVSTTGDDNNDCLSPTTPCATINGAIGKASSGDIINVAVGTYTGNGSEVVLIDKNITLSGGWNSDFTAQTENSVVDGEATRRCVLLTSGVSTSIDRFSIKNGFVTFSEGGGIRIQSATLTLSNSIVDGNNADYAGAGIYNYSSTLNVINSVITNNSGADYGGGIYSYNYFGGSSSLTNSTISFNQAERGGGIFGVNAVVSVNNSTINNNVSVGVTAAGGGIYSSYSNTEITGSLIIENFVNGTASHQDVFGGGIMSNNGTLNVNNSTISGNMMTTPTGSVAYGGGIFNYRGAGGGGVLNINNATIVDNKAANGGGVNNSNSTFYGSGTVDLENTILARNVALTSPNCSGSIGTSGYNLISDNSDCTIVPMTGDQVGIFGSPIDPLLSPLQDNGGPTLTHALLPGSPAIDAGNPAGCTDQDGNPLTTDQRGVTRPQGAACDIGSFELVVASPVKEFTIDIKPGSQSNPINRRSSGKIPVVILSTPDFDAPTEIDTSSLTFGRTGDEASLAFCNKSAEDVNSDGLLDQVCHFYTKKTGFQKGDMKGILKGQTVDGTSIEGSDLVRIVH